MRGQERRCQRPGVDVKPKGFSRPSTLNQNTDPKRLCHYGLSFPLPSPRLLRLHLDVPTEVVRTNVRVGWDEETRSQRDRHGIYTTTDVRVPCPTTSRGVLPGIKIPDGNGRTTDVISSGRVPLTHPNSPDLRVVRVCSDNLVRQKGYLLQDY